MVPFLFLIVMKMIFSTILCVEEQVTQSIVFLPKVGLILFCYVIQSLQRIALPLSVLIY